MELAAGGGVVVTILTSEGSLVRTQLCPPVEVFTFRLALSSRLGLTVCGLWRLGLWPGWARGFRDGRELFRGVRGRGWWHAGSPGRGGAAAGVAGCCARGAVWRLWRRGEAGECFAAPAAGFWREAGGGPVSVLGLACVEGGQDALVADDEQAAGEQCDRG